MSEILTAEQLSAITEKIGAEATVKLSAQMETFTNKMNALLTGTLSKTEFESAKAAIENAVSEVKGIAKTQGTTINELLSKFDNPGGTKAKGIAQCLAEDKEELVQIYKSRNQNKEYLLNYDGKNWTMQPFDTVKAAGPHATVNDVTTAGNTASISQAFSAATLLRMAGDSPIQSLYRNTPWIFDLVNLINVGFDQRFFTWFDENAKQGTSATVLEGGTKPLVQYSYTLNSENYRKEAMLVSFTQEFDLDFGRLEDDILQKSRVDLINRINSAILPRIYAAAVAYNQGATYAPANDKIVAVNDWDVVAALAAQAENATYSTQANTIVVSTNKKYRMNTIKNGQNDYLKIPDILQGLALVSNPEFTTGNVMVGDFKQYNVALRGGIIVKVGYNGTDFAENKFSVVLEQFYYDYISNVRKPAIVKGPDFATVKSAIGVVA